MVITLGYKKEDLKEMYNTLAGKDTSDVKVGDGISVGEFYLGILTMK